MVFKTRRQNRYSQMRRAGFLPFEARPLSKVPFAICPYLRRLIREREGELGKARRQGATQRQWEDHIKGRYAANRWLRAGKKKIEADPWRMLRDYEDKWKAKQPQYTSPWQKRWRNWKDFLAKAERTIAKQKGRVVT